MTDPVRLIIADDHAIVREGLRLVLETEPDLQVVGEAGDGEQAVALAEEHRPDVVLMDLRMPGIGGIEAIRRIRDAVPNVELVVLTTYDEDRLMLEGLRAGARAYLLKDTKRETLVETIRAAARGESLLSSEVVTRLIAESPSAARGPGARRRLAPVTLTPREQEILEAVADGVRSKEIAARFHIAERTVKAHLASIYAKLGVSSRAAAVSKALKEGWLDQGA